MYFERPGIESRWGARFSAPVQTGPGAHPASCSMGYRSFPGVKRPGRGVDHPQPSSAEIKKWVELYLYSPSGSSWPILGWTLPLLYFYFWILHILCDLKIWGISFLELALFLASFLQFLFIFILSSMCLSFYSCAYFLISKALGSAHKHTPVLYDKLRGTAVRVPVPTECWEVLWEGRCSKM